MPVDDSDGGDSDVPGVAMVSFSRPPTNDEFPLADTVSVGVFLQRYFVPERFYVFALRAVTNMVLSKPLLIFPKRSCAAR